MEEFPDIDELQWLESNSNQVFDDDDEDDFYPFESQPDDKQPLQNHHFNPPPNSIQITIISDEDDVGTITNCGKKRSKSPASDTGENDTVHKVARVSAEESMAIQIDDDVVDDGDVWERIPAYESEMREESTYLSRFASEIDGDCVPVTAPGGERVYAKLERKVFSDGDCSSVGGYNRRADFTSSRLISEPVSVMLQKAEQDALLKALRDSSEVEISSISPESSVGTEELWVNKYAPRSFTELLSDEQTNREVLFWLKQWDSTVYGTDIRNTEDEVLSALRRHSTRTHHQKHSHVSFLSKNRGPVFAKKFMGHPSAERREDVWPNGTEGLQNKKQNSSGPPDQKVLLLCGPPGLGKTTLAHVAAKHCGYHVLEINASDDRSSTTLEAKILDAVQMNSVMADSKPKCLVIDEIDGALGDGKGAVEILLKMVAGDAKSHTGKDGSISEEQHGKKSSKKGRKSFSLSRPVICICNDLYAPSLRPLRRIAKVHVFAQPTVNRVVNRLKYICNKEELKTSSTGLTALAEYTECDIRSCLNTLQFLQKKKESLNLVALSSQVMGRKDMTKSVFDVWKEVFQKRKVKQRARCDVSPLKTYEAHDSLYSLVSYRGDYELIFDGIHENFLQLQYHDPLLQKTVHCLNALGISDLFQQFVMRSHNMSLLAYYPPMIITIHQQLARVERATIEWPKSFQRYRTSLMEKIETLRSWQSAIGPCISRHLSVDSFVKDTASLLLHVLSPLDLRPVALHLLSDKEKNELGQLVSTMVSYSLTYKNPKPDISNNSTHDGTTDASQLTFYPPIQGFVCFKDYKSGHCELKSAVKQVVVHEVEKQKIVRESTGRFMHSTESSREPSDAVSIKENGLMDLENTACADLSEERTKKSLQKPCISGFLTSEGSTGASANGRTSVDMVKPKHNGDVKKATMGSFNFFDRFKKLSHKGVQDAGTPANKAATAERDGRVLIFKFNEGFTNAVKRPVRIREFLS